MRFVKHYKSEPPQHLVLKNAKAIVKIPMQRDSESKHRNETMKEFLTDCAIAIVTATLAITLTFGYSTVGWAPFTFQKPSSL